MQFIDRKRSKKQSDFFCFTVFRNRADIRIDFLCENPSIQRMLLDFISIVWLRNLIPLSWLKNLISFSGHFQFCQHSAMTVGSSGVQVFNTYGKCNTTNDPITLYGYYGWIADMIWLFTINCDILFEKEAHVAFTSISFLIFHVISYYWKSETLYEL